MSVNSTWVKSLNVAKVSGSKVITILYMFLIFLFMCGNLSFSYACAVSVPQTEKCTWQLLYECVYISTFKSVWFISSYGGWD